MSTRSGHWTHVRTEWSSGLKCAAKRPCEPMNWIEQYLQTPVLLPCLSLVMMAKCFHAMPRFTVVMMVMGCVSLPSYILLPVQRNGPANVSKP